MPASNAFIVRGTCFKSGGRGGRNSEFGRIALATNAGQATTQQEIITK